MRISRALAMAGIDSRRRCEEHVRNGAVAINGEVVTDVSRNVDPENDAIAFRGRAVGFEKFVYFILHKPVGYITTAQDRHAKKTVFELLPRTLVARTSQPGASRLRVFPVGRLDRDSSGLLFFTNDGDLANRMTHPRYNVPKVYEVRLHRAIENEAKKRILDGVRLSDGVATVEKVVCLSPRKVRVTLSEGKKREVRRLFAAIGYHVLSLCRLSFASLSLGKIRLGEGRFLTNLEIRELRKFLAAKA